MSDPSATLRAMPALGRASSVIGILAAASSLLVSPPAARADPVDIVDDVRGRLRVRLLGIDSPETKKPRFSVGCWGPEASQFAESTLAGQRVALVTDPTQDLHDRYGRTLAYLDKADGWDYSVEAARAGAAHAYIYHDQPAARYPAIAVARRKQSMRSEACGVRPAMATP